jgi:hypothetical protein
MDLSILVVHIGNYLSDDKLAETVCKHVVRPLGSNNAKTTRPWIGLVHSLPSVPLFIFQ